MIWKIGKIIHMHVELSESTEIFHRHFYFLNMIVWQIENFKILQILKHIDRYICDFVKG